MGFQPLFQNTPQRPWLQTRFSPSRVGPLAAHAPEASTTKTRSWVGFGDEKDTCMQGFGVSMTHPSWVLVDS